MLRMLSARRAIFVVLVVAFAVRGAAAVGLQAMLDAGPKRLDLIAGDAEGYWELAQKLTRGDDYSLYDPPRRVLRMPGFPLLLAAGMLVVGERPGALRWLLAAIGTAACGFTYLLGRELFDDRVGVLAALFAALSPPLVLFSVLFLSETLFSAAMLASLWCLARFLRITVDETTAGSHAAGWCWAIASGVSIGAATLVRPTWILAAPVFAAVYAFTMRPHSRAMARSAALLMSCGVLLSPWVYRNWNVTGHFVPTTLWVGASLYDGLNPSATGASDMRFIETDGIYKRLSEYDADRHYQREAWAFAREHPGRTLTLALQKLARYWSPWPQSPQFEQSPVRFVLCAVWLPLLALSLYGGCMCRHRWWALGLAAGPVLYFALVHAVFVGAIRYRIPGEYALYVLSAVGALGVLTIFSKGQHQPALQ